MGEKEANEDSTSQHDRFKFLLTAEGSIVNHIGLLPGKNTVKGFAN